MTPLATPQPDRAMSLVDAMPPDHRRLVHEYGLGAVQACLDAGVRAPRKIAQLIRQIRSATGSKYQSLGALGRHQGNSLLSALDPWLLNQNAGCTGRHVVRLIRDHGFTVLPTSPTRPMLVASIAAVTPDMPRQTVERKHTLRLLAALRDGDRAMWGSL